MSKYILNTMVVLLTLMLYRRSAVSFIKGKWAADKKAAAVLVCVGTTLIGGAIIAAVGGLVPDSISLT